MELVLHLLDKQENPIRVLTIKDDTGLIKGFQEIEDMLKELPDLFPRTIYFHDMKLDAMPNWKAPEDAYVASVIRRDDKELWTIKLK